MTDQNNPLALSYVTQWRAAVTVLVVLGIIALIQTVGPDDLGIPPVAFRWLAIVSGGLAIVQGFLPRIQSVPVENYDEVKRTEALGAAPAYLPALSDDDINRLAYRVTGLMQGHEGAP